MKRWLILLILLFAGCQGDSVSRGDGVWLDVSPIGDVIAGDPFNIEVSIGNSGDYDTKGWLCIEEGFEDRSLWGRYARDYYGFELDLPVSEEFEFNFPGDFNEEDLGYVFRSGKIEEDTLVSFEVANYHSYGFGANVSACYRPISMSEDESCSADDAKIVSSSKSPLQIVKVEERIDEGGIILYVSLEDRGDGEIWDLRDVHSCGRENGSSGYIVFKAVVGGKEGKCDLSSLYSDLSSSGKSIVRCVFSGFGKDFSMVNVLVDGKFGYKVSEKVSIDLLSKIS